MIEALAVFGGYLLGSLPFGYWLPRIFRGEDIRKQGSGNVGASNVFRVYGRRLGIAVALLDLGKGFAAALLGLVGGRRADRRPRRRRGDDRARRPIFLGFQKGGKMVATAGGAFLALAPLAALCCVAVWLVVFLLTRYASLASIATAVALVVARLRVRLPVAGGRVRGRRCGGGHLPPPPEHPSARSAEPSTGSSSAAQRRA